MPIMTKENLIIIPGFASNSRILKGLAQCLSEYFEVFLIALPGFSKNSPPLNRISLENYADFVESEIKKLSLSRYFLFGVSLGFCLSNLLKLDQKCLGIIGFGPYLGKRSLNQKIIKKTHFLRPLLNLTCLSKTYSFAWKNFYFRRLLYQFCPSDFWYQVIREDMDPRTFLETVKLIFSYPKEPLNEDLPYVLIINHQDEIINTDYVLKVSQEKIKNLKIIYTDLEHAPKLLTKEFIQTKITKEKILEITIFFSSIK